MQELHISAGKGEVLERAITLDAAESQCTISIGDGATARIYILVTSDAVEQTHSINATVGAESQCTILTINAAADTSTVSIVQRGEVGSGGALQWQNVTLGGKNVTHDLVSRCTGDNAKSAVDWMFYAKNNEKQLLAVRNIFDGRDGSGEILMRGVAEEKGHAVAKGMIEIGLKGGGTNTYLTQEVLMLDPSAKVDAVPGLEIKTNDVKASHSATVTRLTPEDLFYFASRGIPKSEARAMYIQGFLGAITERITDEKARGEIVALIEKKYSFAGLLV